MTEEIQTPHIDEFIRKTGSDAKGNIPTVKFTTSLTKFIKTIKEGNFKISLVRAPEFTDGLMLDFKDAANDDRFVVKVEKGNIHLVQIKTPSM